MTISKPEQRALHALGQGGCIKPLKPDKARIRQVQCLSREGWLLAQCTMPVSKTLRSKGASARTLARPIAWRAGGLKLVRGQLGHR